jgi:Mn-dependent DtxR family transcriptional regulator
MKRLETLLENGPMAVSQIELELDVSKRTLAGWTKKLDIKTVRVDGNWMWELPN